jgi:predicted transposase/invertase (TIGR01784 family)
MAHSAAPMWAQQSVPICDAYHAIETKTNGLLELIVPVYNINEGHNKEILKRSKALMDYAVFIAKVREHLASKKTLEKAIEKAIRYCISNDVMATFLKRHGSEVNNMLYTEWDWEKALEVCKNESFEDGIEQGIVTVARNMKSAGEPIDKVAAFTGLTPEQIERL